jgi:hypothetical protein
MRAPNYSTARVYPNTFFCVSYAYHTHMIREVYPMNTRIMCIIHIAYHTNTHIIRVAYQCIHVSTMLKGSK